ncbi:MAG: hypothetical protein KDA45_09755 [Planctomycetales bacterium]|nr:hypothetical protein [Planctomycetales bacterium]
MASVHFAIAFIPVAIYFILMGGLRLRTRPLVTTGWRDMLTLGIAASGLVAVGPMQLFFPTQAAARWQGWVWLALLVLYLLGLVMGLLSCKPRLVSYGMSAAQFYTALLAAAQELDAEAAWNGEVLTLPASGMQLAMEPSGAQRVHQVVHVGLLNNLQLWLKLERAFVASGATVNCPRSTAGWPFVLGGCLLLMIAISPLLADPNEALAQLRDFLNH